MCVCVCLWDHSVTLTTNIKPKDEEESADELLYVNQLTHTHTHSFCPLAVGQASKRVSVYVKRLKPDE